MEVEDNVDLARDINAAMYNILCSLPSEEDPLIPFYGLSPGMSPCLQVCDFLVHMTHYCPSMDFYKVCDP